MKESKFNFRNDFLQLYLDYVEETESPRIFHIWGCLTGIGAALGRRVYFPFSRDGLYPNSYVVFVGPPAVRKSTALNLVKSLLAQATNVRIAPDDTGGKYQGLITFLSDDGVDDDDVADLLQNFNGVSGVTPDDLRKIGSVPITVDQRDEHVMFAAASEFSSFIGNNSTDMITFLGKIYDGEDYRYQIKASKQTLHHPLATILAATTPTHISTAIPKEAIGQGFMSRIILVYGNTKYKWISRPKPLDAKLEKEVLNIFTNVSNMEGIMDITNTADTLLNDMYKSEVEISDPRFTHYCDRRHTHLIKLSMQLAASRGSLKIELQDIDEADIILKVTEKYMPEALGEYGLSPLSVAKQQLLEFLQRSKVAVPEAAIWANMQRDMKLMDFKNTLMELTNAKKLFQVDTKEGAAFIYNDSHQKEIMDAMEHLAQLTSMDKKDDDNKIIILTPKKA